MITLREKCLNTEFFQVRIFPRSNWIRRGIQSECEKIRSRKSSVFGHFSRSIKVNINNNFGRVFVIMGDFHSKESELIYYACLNPTFRLSWLQEQLLELFYKKVVLKNFAIFTGKHLYWSLFVNKVCGLRPQENTCAWGLLQLY